jgi:hypothetical protein
MAERKPPSWEDIKELIERVDEVCRESERTRNYADRAMKRTAIWPERRRMDRPYESPHHSSDMGNESSEG